MKLQFAIDLLSTKAALDVLTHVAPYVQVIEAGTPLVKQEGLAVVTAIKTAYPDHEVFADLKTMDAGELEAEIAFQAGADLVTVLALANDETIKGAVKAATKWNRKIIADMIGVQDKVARAKELEALGVYGVEVHSGLDEQAHHLSSTDQAKSVAAAITIPTGVAGGINIKTLADIHAMKASVAVVGAAIYGSPNPGEAARLLHELNRTL